MTNGPHESPLPHSPSAVDSPLIRLTPNVISGSPRALNLPGRGRRRELLDEVVEDSLREWRTADVAQADEEDAVCCACHGAATSRRWSGGGGKRRETVDASSHVEEVDVSSIAASSRV